MTRASHMSASMLWLSDYHQTQSRSEAAAIIIIDPIELITSHRHRKEKMGGLFTLIADPPPHHSLSHKE